MQQAGVRSGQFYTIWILLLTSDINYANITYAPGNLKSKVNFASWSLVRGMDRWMNGWMDMDGWMDRWMDGRMDGWMDGWMKGRERTEYTIWSTLTAAIKYISSVYKGKVPCFLDRSFHERRK